MATIINNPGDNDSSGSAVALIIGIVVLLAVVGLFFVYALPAIRGNGGAPQDSNLNVNVELPKEVTAPAPSPEPAPAQ